MERESRDGESEGRESSRVREMERRERESEREREKVILFITRFVGALNSPISEFYKKTGSIKVPYGG